MTMTQARSDPEQGEVIKLKDKMKDKRWESDKGWEKMRQRHNGVEIHYVRNKYTHEVDDFKIVD